MSHPTSLSIMGNLFSGVAKDAGTDAAGKLEEAGKKVGDDASAGAEKAKQGAAIVGQQGANAARDIEQGAADVTYQAVQAVNSIRAGMTDIALLAYSSLVVYLLHQSVTVYAARNPSMHAVQLVWVVPAAVIGGVFTYSTVKALNEDRARMVQVNAVQQLRRNQQQRENQQLVSEAPKENPTPSPEQTPAPEQPPA